MGMNILELFGLKKRDIISLAIDEAIALMGEESYDEAIAVIENKCLRRNPQDKRSLLHLGVCHMLKKDYDEAERILKPLTGPGKMDSEKAAASIALEKIARHRRDETKNG